MSDVVKMLQIHGTDKSDPMIFCPACKCGHVFPVSDANPSHHRWTWNGSKEKPTFTPSMRVNGGMANQCHSNVTDGMIFFHGDSNHDLKGKTVALEPFTDDMW